MKDFFLKYEGKTNKKWQNEQVFIALGNLLTILAEKRIDSCTIGGFNHNKYDEILCLKEKCLNSVIVLPIGYRSNNDKYSEKPKIRFSKEEIVIKI